MKKTKEVLEAFRTYAVHLFRKHAVALGIVKLLSLLVFFITSMFLTWLWKPQTNEGFGEIGFIAFIASYFPVFCWLCWRGWKCYKSRQKR